MKKTVLTLASILLLALAAAPGAEAQTFIQQVFPDNPRIFTFEATSEAQVALTVMWNRQISTLLAVMACDISGEVFDWAASAPLQDRTLRMDVGVPSGLICAVSVSTDETAAFAINLQSFESADLESLALVSTAKELRTPIRLRQARDVAPEKMARLRPALEAAQQRLERIIRRESADE